MFTLPDLPYGYDSLEPFIDEVTMHLHHDKHHLAYIDNLNKAFQNLPLAKEEIDRWMAMDVKEILQKLDEVPEEIRMKVRNNAGGHANHSFFWKIMSPPKEGISLTAPTPTGDLEKAIDKKFGSFVSFQEKFSNAGLGRFGSGWIWLTPELEILDTPNQDTPLMEGKKAILGLDVWEHAYYILYKWQRAEYIKAWWNVVNWPKVEEYFNGSK